MSNPPANAPVPNGTTPQLRPRGMKLCERVLRKYEDGEIHCKVTAHFQWNGRDLEHKSNARILSLMEPWTPAKCKCERDALLSFEHWRQPIGTLASAWIQEGATQIGVGEKPTAGAPIRKVCPVPYQLTKDDRTALCAAFPGYHFLSTRTNQHDHAVAHTKTLMASALLADSVYIPHDATVMDPVHVLDIYGNPASNEVTNRLNRRKVVHTTCKEVTAKDTLRRKTKWGPQVDPSTGARRWHDLYDREIGAPGASFSPEDLSKVREIHGTHIAYYMSNAERHALLSRAHPDCVMKMLVHKFGEGASGTVNSGEMTWTRKAGIITQTNVESGEFYTHKDTDEEFFNHSYWSSTDGNKGLSWTLNKVTTDTWLVTIVTCTPKACGVHVNIDDATPDYSAPKNKVKPIVAEDPFSPDVIIRDGFVPVHGVEIPIMPQHAMIFDDMRKRAFGKPRNVKLFKSHVQFTVLKTKSLLADKQVPTTAKQACDIAVASFWAGVQLELNVVSDLFDNHMPEEWKSYALYNFGAKSGVRATSSRFLQATLRITGASSKLGAVREAASVIADLHPTM